MTIRSSRLDRMSDSDLLRMRFCDLPLRLKGSVIEHRAKTVFDELAARDINFRPAIWISEQWYNPDEVVGFAIPFYLLHPRLMRLERKLMLEAEGASFNEAMSILRHETGHAVDEAFQLRKMREYRQVFGPPQRAYPKDYIADSDSRDFVQHLNAWYAQSHPVEDFAETFAVWLKSERSWRRMYRDWPAFEKLNAVDAWMRDLRNVEPEIKPKRVANELKDSTRTLGEHYDEKREFYAIDAEDEFDGALRRIFHGQRQGESRACVRCKSAGFPPHAITAADRQATRRSSLRCRPGVATAHSSLPDVEVEANASEGRDRKESFAAGIPCDRLDHTEQSETAVMTLIRKPRKKLCVVLLADERLLPNGDLAELSGKERNLRKTEYDVKNAIESLGHKLVPIGISNEISVITDALEAHKPDIVFNLAEEFNHVGHFDQHVVSFLEMLRQPYTGCNPRGLTIARDKALTKKILAYDGMKVPEFAIFPMRRTTKRPSTLGFPLFVKSLTEEGSIGISGASIVRDDVKLMERVDFIHRTATSAALAEEYIEGREIYVSIMGNERVTVLPAWEFFVENRPDGAPLIATGRGKWDPDYQDQAGVMTGPAEISTKLATKLEKLSRDIYRLLGLSGYARLDFRVTAAEDAYLLEANPNPQIASDEDFASAAEAAGIEYPELIERLIRFGMNYDPERMIV